MADVSLSQPEDPRGRAARNLLFGLLALQNGFIDREALLGAFAAWLDDKSRSLADLLVERGSLDEPRRLLLEALAAEHLRLHGDDPERSLADLSSLGSAGPGLERLGDCDLQASLSLVGANRPDAEATTTFVPSSVPHRAGERFRVLRFHKKGGLGQIYLARDEELGREVALKEILRTRPIPTCTARGSSWRRRSTAGCSTRASCRSTAWATTTTASRSTRCGSWRATA